MKKFLILILVYSPLVAMDDSRPRYHINNKVVYMRETRESGDQGFETVTDFNNAIERQNDILHEVSLSTQKRAEENVAVVNNGMSNKTKIIITFIGATTTIVTAIASAVATYYSKTCN